MLNPAYCHFIPCDADTGGTKVWLGKKPSSYFRSDGAYLGNRICDQQIDVKDLIIDRKDFKDNIWHESLPDGNECGSAMCYNFIHLLYDFAEDHERERILGSE